MRVIGTAVALLLAGTLAAVVFLETSDKQALSPLTYAVAGRAHHAIHLTLRRQGKMLELLNGKTLVRSQALAHTSNVVVRGAAGTRDALTIDFSGGPLAVPGGVRYNGGRGGFDTLRLQARHPQGEILYRMNGPGSGTISLRGLRVAFSNLEPLANVGTSTFAVFELPSGATNATLADDGTPGNGVNRLSGSGFETTDISGASRLTIFLGLGSQTFDFLGFDTADPDGAGPMQGLSTLAVNGGDIDGTDTADDSLRIGGSASPPSSVTLTFSGGKGNDTFTLGSPGSTLDSIAGLGGRLVVNGDANFANPAITQSLSCSQAISNTRVQGDSVVVDDANSPGSHGYRIESSDSSTDVVRDGAHFRLNGVEGLTLNGATAGADAFTIAGYSSPLSRIAISASMGNDIFSATDMLLTGAVFSSTVASANLLFNGQGGADAVTLESLPDSVNTVNGGDQNDSMVLTARDNSGARLNGENGDDTLHLLSSGPGSQIRLDGGAGTNAIVVDPGQQGSVCTGGPTAVRLSALRASRHGRAVSVSWRTGAEVGIAGFDVFRQGAGRFVRANRELIPSRGAAAGHAYRYVDATAPAGSLRYRIEGIGANGARIWLGTVFVR
jgi:hypothetical protein